jgi:heme exporter protein A
LADAAFNIVDVSKRYGPRWALARLSFTLERGKSLLLTGHNGSGKSTLLKLLATASAPTFGKLTILGFDAAEQKEQIRRRVALLSHASFLYEDLTAEQNLVLLARLLGIVDPVGSAKAIIERVGMTKRADNAVRTFSAGMRKRIAIARLLLKKPDLALLDEPFGELDPEGIAVMEKFIHELRATGTTVVLATHLIEQGLTLTDARLHLAEGRTLETAA